MSQKIQKNSRIIRCERSEHLLITEPSGENSLQSSMVKIATENVTKNNKKFFSLETQIFKILATENVTKNSKKFLASFDPDIQYFSHYKCHKKLKKKLLLAEQTPDILVDFSHWKCHKKF